MKKNIQENLQNKSKLPLTFVFVDSTLRGAEKQYGKDRATKSKRRVMDTLCPSNGGSARFTFGYKGMCQFWFVDFQQYVTQYDWLLRVDDDCLLSPFRTSLASTNLATVFPLPDHVPFAAAQWTRAEYCSSTTALTGMMNFTQDFATRNHLTSAPGIPTNLSASVVHDTFKRVPVIPGVNAVHSYCMIYVLSLEC